MTFKGTQYTYNFFDKLDEECQRADITNVGLILELDGNCKLGGKYIKGDKHALSQNGKLFLNVIERNNITITKRDDSIFNLKDQV